MGLLTNYKLSDFTGVRLNKFIKLQLFKYFRFDRDYMKCCFATFSSKFVCSEGINNADINAINDKNLVEVEIKTSKSDFLKEFDKKSKIKKLKHSRYNKKLTYKNYVIPNYFYFCVPEDLKQFVETYLKENGYTSYGILVIKEKRIFNHKSHIEVYKKAKRLHTKPPTLNIFYKIGKRVESEMCNLYEKIVNLI